MVSPAEAAINVNLKEQIAYVLHTLTPREEKIMKMRFGQEDGSEHTLEEVGRSFAVTRERIRQIEAKALCKLRHPSRSHKLKAFFSTTCMNDAQNLHTGDENRGTRGQPANPLSRSLLNNM